MENYHSKPTENSETKIIQAHTFIVCVLTLMKCKLLQLQKSRYYILITTDLFVLLIEFSWGCGRVPSLRREKIKERERKTKQKTAG